MFRSSKAGIRSSSPASDVTQAEENKEKKPDVSKNHLKQTRIDDVAPSRWASLENTTTQSQQSSQKGGGHCGFNRNTGQTPYRLQRQARSLEEMRRFEGVDQSQQSRKATKATNSARDTGTDPKTSILLNAGDVRVLSLDSINSESNNITRSMQGKTSGVFFITAKEVGESKAVLKPVNDNEIIANKLFEILELPIPKFDVWDVNSICESIQTKIRESFQGKTIIKQYKNIMAMERIEGQPLSEIGPVNLIKFLSNKDNLHSLGRSMVFDMLIGNADRIFFYSLVKANPDNIMVKEGNAIFIDQVFTQRAPGQFEEFHERLMTITKAPGGKVTIYTKYISPLVTTALSKYCFTSDEGRQGMTPIETFEKLMDKDAQFDINNGLSEGIHYAMQDLIDKKSQVLSFCEYDKKIHQYLSSIYGYLEAQDGSA